MAKKKKNGPPEVVKTKNAKNAENAVKVVAALIFGGGKFLICQRPAHKARGLMWEFPGGKIEAGETPASALARECREELGVDVEVGEEFMTVAHKYPDIRISLSVMRAKIVLGEPKLLEHAAIKWIYPSEIPNYFFCPADVAVLKKICAECDKDGGKRKQITGAQGEKRAAAYLKKHGYKIIERNLKTPFCEVDIVAQKGEYTVFCEVKTRLSDSFGSPAEAVDEKRRQRYVRAAEYYTANMRDFILRFDVIEVSGKEVNHIVNAYGADC